MAKNDSQNADRTIDLINRILYVTIFVEFTLKILLIFSLKIGWDEFGFLAKVHSYERGELTQTFQTFHAHILGWVSWISGNEVTQIVAGRFLLFLLLISSGFLLYGIARKFVDKTGALFSVFCWISFSNIIYHGSSLRYDSICSFLFILAAYSLLKNDSRNYWAIAAGIVSGLSVLFSIKASIHVASLLTLLVVLFAVSSEKKLITRKALLFIIFVALTAGIGFLAHQYYLSTTIRPYQQDFLATAASKAIATRAFFPRLSYFNETLRQNLLIWWLLAVGITYTLRDIKKGPKESAVLALPFLVPVFSILFYRNAFPYYYAFLIAPAIVLCGILPTKIIRDFQRKSSKGLLVKLTVIFLIILGGAGYHFNIALANTNTSQKELLATVHRMFPEPVPYIDGCSAVSSFPKLGFFMSTWGFETYLAAGSPVFRDILEEKHPEFLLADTPHLDFALPRDHPFFEVNHDFLPEDLEILKDNFVQYWGMIWLPGKVLDPLKPNVTGDFEILIPGRYILESSEPLALDTLIIQPGSDIFLTQSVHTYAQLEGNSGIKLRWNDIKYMPEGNPPDVPYFYGF